MLQLVDMTQYSTLNLEVLLKFNGINNGSLFNSKVKYICQLVRYTNRQYKSDLRLYTYEIVDKCYKLQYI